MRSINLGSEYLRILMNFGASFVINWTFFQAHKYQKKPQKFVDPVLRADKNEMAQIMKCFQVALLCIHDVARHRPTMSEVVTMLGTIKVVQP